MRAHELDARDRLELTAALVEQELDVAERLEPGAESGRRSPHSLGERTDTPAGQRVQVEHPVGLAEPQRAQNDRFGLVRAGRHAASVEVPSVGRIRLDQSKGPERLDV